MVFSVYIYMNSYFHVNGLLLFFSRNFFQLMCSKSCCVYFHKICWKKFKNLKYPGENDQVLFFLQNFTTTFFSSPFSLFFFSFHFFWLASSSSIFLPPFFSLFPWMLYSLLFLVHHHHLLNRSL